MDDFIGGGNYQSQTEKQKNTKKWMKVIGIVLMLLFIASIALIVLMYYIQNSQLKITLDGKAASKLEEVLIFEDGKVYIPIRTFASYVGYESSNGDYNQDKYTEDATKCYVKCSDEVATFSLGSNKIYKTLLDDSNDYEYYEINEPIKMVNNQLCTTIDGAKIAFNISMEYNQKKNEVTIFTLPYLVTYYTAKFQNAGISDKDASFSNQKALLYDMIIVKNAENYYGVYSLNNQEVLGTKYKSIKFVESTKEFIVTTQEDKMGIMSYDSTTKISPEYDNIKQIDKDTELYLVTNNKKQGVINGSGSIVVFIEYDQIGVDANKFANNNIQNQYLLYNNCIPVKRNDLWGLFDKTGKEIVEVKYNDLGCSTVTGTTDDRNANGVLLIPDYECIIVKENDMYGIINSEGETLLQSVLKTVYSTTSAGKTTYSMIYDNQVINVITYIEAYLSSQQENNNNQNEENNQDNNTINENTIENQETNTISNEDNNNISNNEVNIIGENVEHNNDSTMQTNGNAITDNNSVIIPNNEQTTNEIV